MDLNKIYQQILGEINPKYSEEYKETSSLFTNKLLNDEELSDKDLEILIKKKENGIAGAGQGLCRNEEFLKIKDKWNDIYSIIRKGKNSRLTENDYLRIREIIYNSCGRDLDLITNRILSAFFPNDISTTCKEDDFYLIILKIAGEYQDYPVITGNWLIDNYAFMDYCKNHININDSLPLAVFSWNFSDRIKKGTILPAPNVWLLSCNPDKWRDGFDEWVLKIKSGIKFTEDWKCYSSGAKTGDEFFIVKCGREPTGIFAHGKITKDSFVSNNDNKRYVGTEVDYISDYDNDEILSLGKLENIYPQQNWNPRQSGIEIKKKNVMGLKKLWTELIGGNTNMNPNVNLLEKNKNIILHGAPGTGKTYRAKDIAAQMICGKPYSEIQEGSDDEKRFHEQTEFVQFHPSYDYSDFVEGLRPVEGDTLGNVGFVLKNGIFKNFCEHALKNFLDSKKSADVIKRERSNEEKLNNFLANSVSEDTIFTSKKNTFHIKEYNNKHVFVSYKSKDDTHEGKVRIKYSDLLLLLEQNRDMDRSDVKIITRRQVERQEDSYLATITNELRESEIYRDNFSSVEEDRKDSNKLKSFVFIIDEINRGEMSKIFGELFFSIDPDYRGSAGKVKTQYANMLKDSNTFDDALNITTEYGNFFVPENVYIIGTMNDIDRSVESMDFAMRRRFTFVELKAKECTGMIKDINCEDGSISRSEIIDKMNALNAEIEKLPGLSSSYHIGGSYFAKLEKYSDLNKEEALKCLWNNHLEPLLIDYMRGLPSINNELNKLREVFNNPTNNEEQSST